MENVLAIIPARVGSKGIPGKNFRPLAPNGDTPTQLAIRCAARAGCRVVVSSDHPHCYGVEWLDRPRALAQDDTPMGDVVRHVLGEIDGPPEQIIVLIQPTQPLRTPAHITAAIDLLQRYGPIGTVMSVVQTESMDKLLISVGWTLLPVGNQVERRQDGRPTFTRDGTVYAWRREREFYGHPWIALHIPRAESCTLDTAEDWRTAERRLREHIAQQTVEAT